MGFAGYKAGMVSLFAVDNRPKSPTKGEEIKIPATILEAPPLKACGIRLYSSDVYGSKALGEFWADVLEKYLARVLTIPKKKKAKLEELKAKLNDTSEVRLLLHTQPRETGFAKKTPEIFEIPVGGSPAEGFDYASKILGKEIFASDVFRPGEFVDAHAVTKGKGFQGDIKRYGVKLASHKAEFGRRHRQTMGPITPRRCGWWIAQAGQMGFHQRTDYNKQILKIADAKKENINPVSGINQYGLVRSQYLLLSGSLPGAKKRLVILSAPIRPRKNLFTQAPEITYVSLRSQQG